MPATPEPTPSHAPALPLVWRVLTWTASILACLAVFGLYTAPEFMVLLADKVWSCF